MGDVSSEPTMEEILSSIKRVIEESEGVPGSGGRPRRAARPAPASEAVADEDVLELSQPVAFPPADATEPEMPAAHPESASAAPAAEQARVSQAQRTEATSTRIDAIVSSTAAEASRGSLEALSRLVVKPDVAGSDTLESLVRELLRPMLRDWLDAKLPGIVEAMVAKEIERISGRGL